MLILIGAPALAIQIGGPGPEFPELVQGPLSISGTLDVTATIFHGVLYDWPSLQGAANTYLKNDGAGVLTWETIGGGTVTQIDSGAALFGGPITAAGTLEVKYDNSTIGLKTGSGSLEVVDNAVTDAKIAAHTTTKITVPVSKVTGLGKLATSNEVTATEIADSAVTSAKIKDGEIAAVDFGTGVVTSGAIAADAVITAKILDKNVTGVKIADNTITAAKMGTGSVTSDAILDGTIAAADFGTGVVTSGAIADNTITAAKMGTGSVTSDAILNGTIVGGDLATDINISTTGTITSGATHVTGDAVVDGNLKVTGTIEGESPVKIAGGLNVLTGNVGIGTSNPTGILQVTTLEGAVPAIFVTLDGRIGIGTTDPEYKLYVDGSKDYAQAMYCKNELSSGNVSGLYIWSNITNGTGNATGLTSYANARNGTALGIYNMADASFGFGDQTAYGIQNNAKPRGLGEGYGIKDFVWNYSPSEGSTNYGYYGQVGGATNNYGVYTIADKNYFSGKVGIGTTNPTATLKVVGSAEIGESSCSATGINSVAMGSSSTASGNYSVAMGISSTADGYASFAAGSATRAAGDYSVALGWLTTAHSQAVAIGQLTSASGQRSMALGSWITSTGTNSFGIGLDTTSRTVSQNNTLAIMGGKVGIGTTSPTGKLSVTTLEGAIPSLFVKSDGNVGVNTTSPSAALHVASSVYTGEIIHFTDCYNYGGGIGLDYTGATRTWIGSSYNDDNACFDIRMKGLAYANTKVTILGNGKVGIGVVAPAYMLVVSDSADTGYTQPALLLAPGLTAGHYAYMGIGKDDSKYNRGEIAYQWNADQSTANVVGLGFHSAGMQLKVYPNGNVSIVGTLSKGGGLFLIDHPLDPLNKVLRHSFVESPEMRNIYEGAAVFDGNGEAAVQLPEYFEALNKDFRYQLTTVGGYAPVYVKDEINNNKFVIAGGNPGLKVCWMVTGTRQDAYAKNRPIIVEEAKGTGGASEYKPGEYIHPDAFK